jgi:fatty acid/phospholipid biosynthesis enzyme
MLDLGADIAADAAQLVEFAIMGAALRVWFTACRTRVWRC